MLREIITIDREQCNGCGQCIPNCHEGALQMIDGKATLISELMCDGLGACIGFCPVGAIHMETREAEAYDEVATIQAMLSNGMSVVYAHLKHLLEHNEQTYYEIALTYLKQHPLLPFNLDHLLQKLDALNTAPLATKKVCAGTKTFSYQPVENTASTGAQVSALSHWPIQLHLIQPQAQHFKQSHLLLAADCVAFSLANFHANYLVNKTLCIACPKLDTNKDIYVQKLIALIDHAAIKSLTVMKMEVPCCNGILQMAQTAQSQAKRLIDIKVITVSTHGVIKAS